jgi:hypothetical protein
VLAWSHHKASQSARRQSTRIIFAKKNKRLGRPGEGADAWERCGAFGAAVEVLGGARQDRAVERVADEASQQVVQLSVESRRRVVAGGFEDSVSTCFGEVPCGDGAVVQGGGSSDSRGGA